MGKKELKELVYFGKPGSFTHLVAKRIGGSKTLIPKDTIAQVIDYVQKDSTREAVVPIENSSGGMILDTIDELVRLNNQLVIQEEYSLNVKLHLMMKNSGKITKIYSHFVPFHHCNQWLKSHFPEAERIVVNSTSEAAQLASVEKGAAAIAQLSSSKEYQLKILHRNVGDHPKNITQFYHLSHRNETPLKAQETSLAVVLQNKTGSLYDLLSVFAKHRVNLKRIMSRPMPGHVNHYVFFLSVEAPMHDPSMIKSIKAIEKLAPSLKILGSYPVHPAFNS